VEDKYGLKCHRKKKVTLKQVFLRVLRFSPVKINSSWPSMLIYHLGINTRRVDGREFRDIVLSYCHEQQEIIKKVDSDTASYKMKKVGIKQKAGKRGRIDIEY
jgi:hypothetical protein